MKRAHKEVIKLVGMGIFYTFMVVGYCHFLALVMVLRPSLGVILLGLTLIGVMYLAGCMVHRFYKYIACKVIPTSLYTRY